VDKLEDLGGACRIKACSWFYEQMKASAAKYQREIDSKERIIVGVNDYVMDEKDTLATFAPHLREYDPALLQKQIDRLNKIRRERDHAKVEEAKKMLYQAFKDKVNIMPPLVEAVKTHISGGEVIKVLMEARGEQYGPRGGNRLENELELALFTYH
jgi:methylmalonyl-CoA mutase N-terminal domain/subunit